MFRIQFLAPSGYMGLSPSIWFCGAFLSVLTVLYMFKPSILQINYFYLKMGIVLAALPPLSMLLRFPKFLSRYLNIATYFFVFNLIYEITAVKLDQWSFPAENQLVGIVEFMGVRFAFEELSL